MSTPPLPFLDQLDERARASDSLLCIGLDPHPHLLPDVAPDASPEQRIEAARAFCYRLIDATHDLACAFKPNSAFFESLGVGGLALLQDVIAHVPPGIPIILDSKRGDIPSTAEAYARAAFDVLGASALTVSPYVGEDSIAPFLDRPERGAFVLCKTSNPGADSVQGLPVQNGTDKAPLYQHIARLSLGWNRLHNLGLVVGATDPAALAEVRRIVPEGWFLVPGIGEQGGDLESTVRAGLRADRLGLLINASRSIAQAADPRTAALRLRNAINAARTEAVDHPTPAIPLASANKVRAGVDRTAALDRLGKALAEAGCVKFGDFTLKSGQHSPIYLDLRRLVSYPRALRIIGEELAHRLESLTFDHMVGIPYAALPIATAAALISEKSLIYPRREAKTYGTKAAIEGVFAAGEVAVLIDDLATTGETKFETIARLTEAGLIVQDIVVVIDRGQGAADTLQKAGYRFHAVATLPDLLTVWQAQGILSAADHQRVLDYLAGNAPDPNHEANH